MQHHSPQNNAFRTITNLKALRSSSRSDNTFKGAKLAGVLSASSSPVTVRTVGEVSKSDPADIYKLVVQPGAYFPTSSYTAKITGSGLKCVFYLQHPDFSNNQIRQQRVGKLKGSTSGTDANLTYNDSFDPMTIYIKFVPDGKKTVKYDLSTTYYPSSAPSSSNTDSGFNDPFFNDPAFSDPFFNDPFF